MRKLIIVLVCGVVLSWTAPVLAQSSKGKRRRVAPPVVRIEQPRTTVETLYADMLEQEQEQARLAAMEAQVKASRDIAEAIRVQTAAHAQAHTQTNQGLLTPEEYQARVSAQPPSLYDAISALVQQLRDLHVRVIALEQAVARSSNREVSDE